MTKLENTGKHCKIYYSGFEVEDMGLFLASTEKGLALIEFTREEDQLIKQLQRRFPNAELINDKEKNSVYESALKEYFSGTLHQFNVPLDLIGTEFQKKVWRALMEIPYGETCSYKEIALKINHPMAVRAIGMANNRNNIPIIIPCHRVIGADGSLVGYGGGLHIKEKLLLLEGVKVVAHKKVVK